MTWADEEDMKVLLGDTSIGGIDTQGFLDRAQEEIEVWLGEYYDVEVGFPIIGGPAAIPAVPELAPRMFKALKLTQERIAAGRLLMAQCAGNEDDSLHAYGHWLLGMGLDDMYKFGTTWKVEGATLVAGQMASDMTPSVIQPNLRSPFERFEKAHYNPTHGPAFEEIPVHYASRVVSGG